MIKLNVSHDKLNGVIRKVVVIRNDRKLIGVIDFS